MIDSSSIGQPDPDRKTIQLSASPASSPDGPVTVIHEGPLRRHENESPDPDGIPDSELQRRLFPSHSSHEFVAPFDPRGVQLDHIHIEQMIGRGGMGAVFRATDDRLDRVVALKVLSPMFSRDPATVERFRNEAKSAARLDHENVARVFYSGQNRGLHFIAFEFVNGTNLRDLIVREGRLDPAEAVNYTLQIAAALRHTSENGVVHRDIKPSNIIITPSGRAKLVDLGLARKETSEASADLTVAGTTLGTFDYISPEQAKDPRDVDVRSDIYSLGCTLYHMLTGEPPYPHGNFVQKLLERQDRSPPDPALRAPSVGPELSAVVQRMMAPRPRQRYADADELLNDLMHVAGHLGLRGVHPEGLVWARGSKLQRTRVWERHLGWIVTAALLLLAVFGIDYFSRQSATRPSDVIANTGADEQNSRARQPLGKTEKPIVPIKMKAAGNKTVGKPGPITLKGLEPEFWESVAPYTAGLGASSIAARLDALDPYSGTDPLARMFPSQAARGKTVGSRDSRVAGPKAIALRTPTGEPGKTFPSLEAACAAAADGDVILLSFNGVRQSGGKPVTDKPLRVRNKITIRAAAGYHPVIRFAGAEVPSSDPQTRMITMTDSSLSVIGVHFEMHVDEQLDADNEARWAVFSLQGADRIWLREVRIFIDNPKARSAAVFEISPKMGPDLAKMKMMKKAGMEPRDRFELKVVNSLVTGECDLLAAVNPRPGSLDMQHSAVIAGGAVLAVSAGDAVEMLPEGDRIDLKFEHVTCLVGRSFIELSAQNVAGVLPISVASHNNLFTTSGERAFVSMTGSGKVGDFQLLLQWEGQKNFFDRFKAMWMVDLSDIESQPVSMAFADWKNHWGNQDVDARQGGVVWKSDWSGKAADRMSVSDLRLDTSVGTSENPAATGSTDGTAVGADLSRIPNPKPTLPPSPNPAEPEPNRR